MARTPTVPGGTFADIGIVNHDQDGNETLEVWLRPTPVGGGFTRTTAGKLARYVHDDGGEPFSLLDWTYLGTGAALSIDGPGRLVIDNGSGASQWQGALHTAVAARSVAMAQCRSTLSNTAPAANDNMGVGVMAEGVGGDLTALMACKRVGPASSAGQRIDFMLRLANGAGTDVKVFGDDTRVGLGVFSNHAVYVDATPVAEGDRIFQGWNNVDNDLKDGQPEIDVLLTLGQACIGNFAGATHDVLVEEFYYHADKFVVFAGTIPNGWKCQLRNGADAVVVEQIAAGGGASIDLMAEQIFQPEIAAAVLLDATDSEIGRVTPSEGVWGGDVYTFVPAVSGAWALEASLAVSSLADQVVRIEDLLSARIYDVALRYRRGVLYNPGAENTADPTTWPSISRGDFTTTVDPPTIASATWERTSAIAERIRLTITPVPGQEALDILVYRRADGGGTPLLIGSVAGPHVGDAIFDDTTIVGETGYSYSVVTSGIVVSPLSAETRVWAGPAAIPFITNKFFSGGGYKVGFTTTDPTLQTECWDQFDEVLIENSGVFALRETVAAGIFEAGLVPGPFEDAEATVSFGVKVRHKATAFAVDDFGEYSNTVTVTWTVP